jgi:hypothetical protein
LLLTPTCHYEVGEPAGISFDLNGLPKNNYSSFFNGGGEYLLLPLSYYLNNDAFSTSL